MNVELLQDEKDKVKLRVENEFATLLGAVKNELWSTKGVDVAVLNKRHPLVGKPELTVHGKDAKKLVKTATQKFKEEAEEFEKNILKLI